jgi:tRNA pseudouridine38-40 synthase
MRYFLHIGYDGSKYRGWQRQAEAKSVQETIEVNLERILKSKVTVYGCGRTDAGVHASQYTLHINLEEAPAFDLKFRLNKNLPEDIVVYDVILMEDRQHARYDAISRTYDYFVHFNTDPVLNKYSTYYELEQGKNSSTGTEKTKLDFKLMKKAATMLLQGKDFRHFCKQPDIHNHTLCEVANAKLSVNSTESRMHFTMTANRFLRGMMRIIVATLIEIGLKNLSLEEFKIMLQNQGEETEKQPAHPNGLYLSKVKYPYLNLEEQEGVCRLLKGGY